MPTSKPHDFIDKCFKDSHGRIVLMQLPNIPLFGWIACEILARIVSSTQAKTGFHNLGSALLLAWAYLEITQGVNYFRRALGFIVFASLALGYFTTK